MEATLVCSCRNVIRSPEEERGPETDGRGGAETGFCGRADKCLDGCSGKGQGKDRGRAGRTQRWSREGAAEDSEGGRLTRGLSVVHSHLCGRLHRAHCSPLTTQEPRAGVCV